MLEIYNETIRDLLAVNQSSGSDSVRTENGVPAKQQYTIKHDANGNTYVSDLTIVDVCSIKEISLLLHKLGKCFSGSDVYLDALICIINYGFFKM